MAFASRWIMRPFSLAVLLLSTFVVPAAAEVAVVSGGSVKLGTFGSVDPVCHPLGGPSVSIIEQPHAGAVLVSAVRDYPNFSTLNTRAACNTRKVPQTRITYQSSAGFVGTDSAAVELVFPGGNVRRFRFTISVREAGVPPSVPSSAYVSSPPAARCSREADKLDLHGEPRLDFRQDCKQRAMMAARPHHAGVRHVDQAVRPAAPPPSPHNHPPKPVPPQSRTLAI